MNGNCCQHLASFQRNDYHTLGEKSSTWPKKGEKGGACATSLASCECSRSLVVAPFFGNYHSSGPNKATHALEPTSCSIICAATSRRSEPTTSGRGASGFSTFPGRATNAAAQPARIAPATSQA